MTIKELYDREYAKYLESSRDIPVEDNYDNPEILRRLRSNADIHSEYREEFSNSLEKIALFRNLMKVIDSESRTAITKLIDNYVLYLKIAEDSEQSELYEKLSYAIKAGRALIEILEKIIELAYRDHGSYARLKINKDSPVTSWQFLNEIVDSFT